MHVRASNIVWDSGLHAVDSRFQALDYGFFVNGTWIRIPNVSRIPDSVRCIPDSKAQDSGFHEQKISWNPDSKNKNSLDSGIRIPLNAAIAVNKVTLSNRSQSKGRGKKGKFKSWLARHSTDMTLN